MFGIGNGSPNYEDSLSRIARINLFEDASIFHGGTQIGYHSTLGLLKLSLLQQHTENSIELSHSKEL